MRRIFWGLVGIGIGVTVGIAVVRWTSRTKERYSPPNLAREAGSYAAGLGGRLRRAIEAGREEMVVKEAEIREELGLSPS
ncbi:MAG: hypothetical protein ACRDKS_07935 [Actinomycetota bacterium]